MNTTVSPPADFSATLMAPPSGAWSLGRIFHETLAHGTRLGTGYQPGFDAEALAWHSPDEEAQGHLEFVRLARGVWLMYGDMQLNVSRFIWHREERAVHFSMLLRGAAMIGTPAAPHRRVLYTDGCAVATACAGDTLICRHSLPGVRCQGVSVIFDDDEAMRDFGLDPIEARRWIASAEPGSAGRALIEHAPRVAVSSSNLPAVRAAQAILWNGFDGSRRRLYLRSKVGEMLCHLLAGAAMAPGDALSCAEGAPRQDDDSLAAIVHAALSDPQDCPEITELAARLDVSPGRLIAVFKSRYGKSPRDHALATRMERAKQLIQRTRTSLLDVALSCGYEHHSSFSTAYRRVFGETPLETRRKAAAEA